MGVGVGLGAKSSGLAPRPAVRVDMTVERSKGTLPCLRVSPASMRPRIEKDATSTTTAGESFELELDLVRASRDEHVEGLLVWGIRAKGEPIETILASLNAEGGPLP